MRQFNEFSKLMRVAIRSPIDGFVSQEKLDREWRTLRFKDVPNFEKACTDASEYKDELIKHAQNYKAFELHE